MHIFPSQECWRGLVWCILPNCLCVHPLEKSIVGAQNKTERDTSNQALWPIFVDARCWRAGLQGTLSVHAIIVSRPLHNLTFRSQVNKMWRNCSSCIHSANWYTPCWLGRQLCLLDFGTLVNKWNINVFEHFLSQDYPTLRFCSNSQELGCWQ